MPTAQLGKPEELVIKSKGGQEGAVDTNAFGRKWVPKVHVREDIVPEENQQGSIWHVIISCSGAHSELRWHRVGNNNLYFAQLTKVRSISFYRNVKMT